MTAVHLSKLTSGDADELLSFELANREYFERWINARDPNYYDIESVRRAIECAERERLDDQSHQFLVRTSKAIVGRVNLTAVTRPYFNKATLGYRIGAAFAGNGYASQAVRLALEEGFGRLRLWRIEATARPENIGSVRVLERNEFSMFGRARKCMQLHGTWYDLLHFERHAPQDA